MVAVPSVCGRNAQPVRSSSFANSVGAWLPFHWMSLGGSMSSTPVGMSTSDRFIASRHIRIKSLWALAGTWLPAPDVVGGSAGGGAAGALGSAGATVGAVGFRVPAFSRPPLGAWYACRKSAKNNRHTTTRVAVSPAGTPIRTGSASTSETC